MLTTFIFRKRSGDISSNYGIPGTCARNEVFTGDDYILEFNDINGVNKNFNKHMMTYLKLIWILIKAQFCRIFLRKLNVSFIKVNGSWYCDIKGWPERFFPNALMVGDASRLIQMNSDGKEYVTFEVVPSRKKRMGNLIELTRTSSSTTGGGYYKTGFANADLSNVWLCPVTLFVLGRYPEYIYFRRIEKK